MYVNSQHIGRSFCDAEAATVVQSLDLGHSYDHAVMNRWWWVPQVGMVPVQLRRIPCKQALVDFLLRSLVWTFQADLHCCVSSLSRKLIAFNHLAYPHILLQYTRWCFRVWQSPESMILYYVNKKQQASSTNEPYFLEWMYCRMYLTQEGESQNNTPTPKLSTVWNHTILLWIRKSAKRHFTQSYPHAKAPL